MYVVQEVADVPNDGGPALGEQPVQVICDDDTSSLVNQPEEVRVVVQHGVTPEDGGCGVNRHQNEDHVDVGPSPVSLPDDTATVDCNIKGIFAGRGPSFVPLETSENPPETHKHRDGFEVIGQVQLKKVCSCKICQKNCN